MKNSRDLILGKVVYISIIYRISDPGAFSLYGYDFYFDHMTGENRELGQLVISGSKQATTVTSEENLEKTLRAR